MELVTKTRLVTQCDLDLLARRRDFNKARSLLIDLGFEPVYQADDYHQTFQRRNTCIELHFSVAPPASPAMDLDRVWDRARVVEFRQQKIRFFSNPDLLIYLIIHGVKHEFARLIWVLDIARALADLSDDDLNEVFKLARALGVEGAFLTSCELARYSFDTVLPSRVVTAIERQPVISAQAHALWERVVTAVQYQRTLYAVSSSSSASRETRTRVSYYFPFRGQATGYPDRYKCDCLPGSAVSIVDSTRKNGETACASRCSRPNPEWRANFEPTSRLSCRIFGGTQTAWRPSDGSLTRTSRS
jgi:hypothetical protein